MQISEDDFLKRERARKKKQQIFDWADAEELIFPDHFTIHITHVATGEGFTRALAFFQASDAQGLRRIAEGCFGAYLSAGAEIRQGLNPLPSYLDLIPDATKKLLAEIKKRRGPFLFQFSTQLHANYS